MEQIGIPLYIIDGYNVILHGSFSSGKKDVVQHKERFLRGLDSYVAKKRVQWELYGLEKDRCEMNDLSGE